MFKLNQDGNVNGTCRQSEVMASPSRLVDLFGEPEFCDGYKVSGEYIFEGENGEVFTLYDWKSTSLYNPTYGTPPEMFWAGRKPVQFNVGGHGYAGDFVQWLKNKL